MFALLAGSFHSDAGSGLRRKLAVVDSHQSHFAYESALRKINICILLVICDLIGKVRNSTLIVAIVDLLFDLTSEKTKKSQVLIEIGVLTEETSPPG